MMMMMMMMMTTTTMGDSTLDKLIGGY